MPHSKAAGGQIHSVRSRAAVPSPELQEPMRSVTLVEVSRRVRNAPALRRRRWLWRAVGIPYRGILRALSYTRGVGRSLNGETFRWRYPFSEFDQDFEADV